MASSYQQLLSWLGSWDSLQPEAPPERRRVAGQAPRNSEAKTQGRSSVVTGPAHCWAPGGTADQASNASSRCSKVEQQKAEKNPADTPRQSSRQQRVRGG